MPVKPSVQSSPTKIIRSSPNSVVTQYIQSRRTPGGALITVLEPARHPISTTGDLTNRPGHPLQLEVDQRHRFSRVLTGPAARWSAFPQPRQKPGNGTPIGSH